MVFSVLLVDFNLSNGIKFKAPVFKQIFEVYWGYIINLYVAFVSYNLLFCDVEFLLSFYIWYRDRLSKMVLMSL